MTLTQSIWTTILSYPVAGMSFPDEHSFRKYGIPEGFTESQRADWRRDNVNKLVSEIKRTILLTKPWVRFGISPFGIYRNQRSTPDGSGSKTKGLQNYDDLYADVLHWVKQGWIDYNMPQIYWEIGHPAADYSILAKWWNKNAYRWIFVFRSGCGTHNEGRTAHTQDAYGKTTSKRGRQLLLAGK